MHFIVICLSAWANYSAGITLEISKFSMKSVEKVCLYKIKNIKQAVSFSASRKTSIL